MRCAVHRRDTKLVSVIKQKIAKISLADACGVLQHRAEHELKFSGRTGNDLQDFRSGRLLGECFFGLIKQAHVFDCDKRLIGKCPEKLNLAVRKKPRLPPCDKYRSDDPPIADHRHTEAATKPARARSILGLIRSIDKDVWNMADGSRSYRTRYDRLGIAPHRIRLPDRLHAFLRHTVDRNQADLVTIDH